MPIRFAAFQQNAPRSALHMATPKLLTLNPVIEPSSFSTIVTPDLDVERLNDEQPVWNPEPAANPRNPRD
jgi:hypothetical protein